MKIRDKILETFRKKSGPNNKLNLTNSYLSKEYRSIRRVYKCFYCFYSAPHKYKLKKHIKLYHLISKSYKCNICELIGTEKHIMRHIKDFHAYNLYPCKFSSSWKNQIKRSMSETSLPGKTFPCLFCKLKATHKGIIENHIKLVHPKEKYNICPYCDYFAAHSDCLKKHVKYSHNKINTNFNGLINNHKNQIESEKLNYELEPCEICDNTFCIQDEINKMVLLSCIYCEFKSFSKGIINQHYKSFHSKQLVEFLKPNKTYCCQVCNFNTDIKTNLIDHIIVTHRSNKVFEEKILKSEIKEKHVCSICGFVAKNKILSKIHLMSVHCNGKLFCSLERKIIGCDYKTYSWDKLNKHFNKMHKGIKKYFCSHCEYRAEFKDQIKKHVVEKHADTTFTCWPCGFKANTKFEIDKHFNISHSREKYYSCSLCGYKTLIEVNISKHMNTVHSNDKENCDKN